MEKYLFTDGTNGVREVQSKEELDTVVQSYGDTGKIRIWIFSTSEWITYTEFSKRSVAKVIPIKKVAIKEEKKKEAVIVNPKKREVKYTGAIKFLIVTITGAAIFLVYNFSRVKWHTASSLQITAAWPDRIELQLKSDRDTNQSGTKFYNIEISIDNSTGYNIDNAVAELKEWKNGQVNSIDTIHFSNIGYSELSDRKLPAEYRGDSLSISFLSIRARSFNFCYSSDKQSNYGNFNDRWFCRE
jgi:hypothetical protein